MFVLVRPGEAAPEAGDSQPWDPALSAEGLSSAKGLWPELKKQQPLLDLPPLRRIFSSPAGACVETAAAIAEGLSLGKVLAEPSLVQRFDEDFYRSWAVPGCCVAADGEDVRPEALMPAGQLVPTDFWVRHPERAPKGVDTVHKPVLQPNSLGFKWGNFETEDEAAERLEAFLRVVARSGEAAVVVVGERTFQEFCKRELPGVKVKEGCCGLLTAGEGTSWQALALVAPGAKAVKVGKELARAEWAKVQKPARREELPRKQFTAAEALEMLEIMEAEKELLEASQPPSQPLPLQATQFEQKEVFKEEPIPPGREVAAGCKAEGSSELPGHRAANAVDGDDETSWMASMEDDENRWLVVDLARTQQIGRVELEWLPQKHPEGYVIQGGADGKNWITLAAEVGSSGKVATALPSVSSVRWLRVKMERPADLANVWSDAPALGLRHLKVYGCERQRASGPSGATTRVSVRTIAGKELELEVAPGELVASLSRRVSEELSWGSSVARLVAGEEVLDMAAVVPARQVLVAVREPRATRVLAGSVDGVLQLHDVESGETLQTFQGHRSVVTCVSADFVQQRAMSGSRDRTLRVWDLATGQVVLVFEAHEGGVNCVAADFNSKLALSGSEDKTLRLWDLDSCEEICTMCHGSEVTCLHADFSAKRAITGGLDGACRLWDLENAEILWEKRGHRLGASCVVADFNLHKAISGSEDKTLLLWDLKTGATGAVLRGHTSFVRCIEANFRAKRALSGGADATLRFWDLEKERLLLTIDTNAGWVWCVAASFQEERALSGSAREQRLRMWDLGSGRDVSTEGPAMGMQGVRCMITNFS